ncbi:putative eukaryotic translation initiation factor [Leishmania major strain Friedlin]|uniref:Putative eukaryotic translation initiation factor n=1 Tax=Leishmania major TaxID=5664 RepID=Q4Q813_LEIMA|nr:putative eukaryotic translation initiation factor [Leishmania major strain Friedlin]CAG9577365.1 eukaryotic_translation_initiation_factor_4E_-_putative [Leishmania major strain Friedlin]CAJ05707.1 putative eukaryotic translation initiation factor [Leishmania major strain Friedlin]|eukprot:XP_001684535.1 putative eukaryotic translation initiation factor [Leishmania major strain Friedlin]
MNPSAAAYIPQQSDAKGDPKSSSAAAVAKPPSTQPATKLSAAAEPFVPGGPKQMSATSTHVDPKATTEDEKTTAPLLMECPASSLPDSAAAAGAAKKEADENDDSQLDWLPEAQPTDWSESKLPKLFGCHNTAAKATSSAIPLHASWDLYADDHQGSSNMASNSSPTSTMSFEPIFVSNVGDVESFWRLWRYLPAPSALPTVYTYSWFRKDIKPEWEHPRNKKGGTISIVVFDRDRSGLSDKQVLDDVFMAMLVGAVGESFHECSTTLNGIMLKVRSNKPVTLQLWTAHSEVGKLKAFANSVRDTLTKIMGAKTLQKLEYYSHHQKQAATNSLAARMKGKTKISPDHTF